MRIDVIYALPVVLASSPVCGQGAYCGGPVVPTAIWRLLCRAGIAHCDLVLAVVGSAALQLRSGSADCDLELVVPTGDLALAVHVRYCHCNLVLAVEVR